MNFKKIGLIALVLILLASLAINCYLAFTIAKINKIFQVQQINQKILAFRNMFTENVLLADKEIDFETRLALETAVRALNDQEIFSQWERFTKSQTREEASAEAKKLLHLLVQKTSF